MSGPGAKAAKASTETTAPVETKAAKTTAETAAKKAHLRGS